MAGNWFWSRQSRQTETIAQTFRFGLVGGSTFVIYFVLQILLDWAGMAPLIALTIAYGIATCVNYIFHRIFTFQWTSGGRMESAGSLVRYTAVNLVSYGITLVVVQAVRALGFDIRIGMLAGIGATTVTGYLMYRLWVFD